MTEDRRQAAHRVRCDAAEMARARPHPAHRANGDEQAYAGANYAMSFTKGLEHDKKTGLVADVAHAEAYRRAIDDGRIDAFTTEVPVPTTEPFLGLDADGAVRRRRQWEAPTAGVVYDLEGPDAQAVTMPPAPGLGSDELTYEMAEVYELAVLRDVPFAAFDNNLLPPADPELAKVAASVARLNAMAYKPASGAGRPRKTDETGAVGLHQAFRGASPGVDRGPYLSQFLLIGTDLQEEGAGGPESGQVRYGAQTIDQRVPVAVPGQDYMTTEDDWFHVQNGANVRDDGTLFGAAAPRRFIATPRDLATYVHDDALYQAYLNACLILLAQDAPLDPAFDRMVGRAKMTTPAGALERNATGFALFGGPHILTLVTEVATRALKAVRFQKYNVHLRLRPETLGGRLVKHADIKAAWPIVGSRLSTMAKDLGPTFNAVRKLTAPSSTAKTPVYLPMAFQEGSPMHPAYGAGHATVAGACVTVLKAFFDTGAQYLSREETRPGKPARQVERFRRPAEGDAIRAYAPAANGATLDDVSADTHLPLTLEGELNKLCANISIGRNMGGVHYFSDYYDSARMGEAIAIGMLEEQALCYAPDRFVLSLPTFDGEELRIGRA